MALNPVTCGNCGTINPPGQDFCVKCGQPLTGSAEQAIRENLEAERHGGLLGNDATPAAGAPGPGMVGGAGGIVTGLNPGMGEGDEGRPR